MTMVFTAEPVPLRQDEHGDIRIGESRVLLDVVVHAFDDGATPETIVQRYPTLDLRDTYGAIAFYLRHRADVGQCLRARESRAEEVQRGVRTPQADVAEIRRRLLERRAQGGAADAPTPK